jgi:hypothetical protein
MELAEKKKERLCGPSLEPLDNPDLFNIILPSLHKLSG